MATSMSLNTLQENASRLGMRLQESFSEHTRDLAITKASGASFFDTAEEKVKNIRKQLDSNNERDKLEAMKRLIAMISKGRDVSEFFAQVVKNVASSNLEIRKLVYIYLLRYAEHEPDLALLSINTFQKDLMDPNPLIRAMALRVLSGVKVPMIGSIVVLGIKKCAADPSPYVRKAAALAIPKLHSFDSSQAPALRDILVTMLRDRSPVSIGCVAVAFSAVCPERLDLLHTHYRRLCRILVDVDEWGQVSLLDLLLRYARQMLPKPQYADEGHPKDEVDKDVHLLLAGSEPLFLSRNPAVALSACRTYYSLSGDRYLFKIIPCLLRLTHPSPYPEIKRVIFPYIAVIAQISPDLLLDHCSQFFVLSYDLPQVKKAKMQILRSLVRKDNVQTLIREFSDYAMDTDDQLVADSIHAIGHCARVVPDSIPQCLTALMNFIQTQHDIVVGNAVLVLKSLVQSQLPPYPFSQISSSSKAPLRIVERLAYKIDVVRHPSARACILWLVGQYAMKIEGEGAPFVSIEGVADWAPDTLRKVAKTFMQELSIVKLQAITLAAKLLVLNPAHTTLILLARYILSLARYDLDYDVRDRGRMIGTLLTGVVPALRPYGYSNNDQAEDQAAVILRREQVKVVLFEGKLQAAETESIPVHQDFLASISTILGKRLPGGLRLTDWFEQGTDSSLRDTEEDIAPIVPHYAPRAMQNTTLPRGVPPIVLTPTRAASPTDSFRRKGKWTDLDLDKFYEDDTEDEDEDEGDITDSEKRGESSKEISQDPALTTSEDTNSEESEGTDDEDDEDKLQDGANNSKQGIQSSDAAYRYLDS